MLFVIQRVNFSIWFNLIFGFRKTFIIQRNTYLKKFLVNLVDVIRWLFYFIPIFIQFQLKSWITWVISFTYIWILLHEFFTKFFLSNTRLKLAKNEAKAKQHPEAELLLIWKLFTFFIHVIIQNKNNSEQETLRVVTIAMICSTLV